MPDLTQLTDRMKTAQEILKGIKRMERDGYAILIRPQMKMGGIIFAVDTIFTSEGPQRFIHFVDYETLKPFFEPMEEYNDLENGFVSNITKFGCVWLTCRQNHLPEAQKIYWLHPDKAERYVDKKNEVKSLMQALNELKRRNDELEDENNELIADIEALNERLDGMGNKIRKLSKENEILRADKLEYSIEINRLKSAMLKTYGFIDEQVRIAKERGEYEASSGWDKLKKDISNVLDVTASIRKTVMPTMPAPSKEEVKTKEEVKEEVREEET